MSRCRVSLITGLFVSCWAAWVSSAHAAVYVPLDKIEGPTCIVLDSSNNASLPLSPEVSQYNITITDGFAHIRLTQLYVNRFQHVNDIVYVYPLPHKGSVHAMSMEYNDSLYTAEIFEKQRAQDLYDSVKTAGGVAALLLQQKPNIFQQRLANIAWRDSAFIRIEVSMPLAYNNGEFELALPTRVATRFGGERGMPGSGENPWNPSPDVEGQRLFITTLIQTGYPIAGVMSPTHPVTVTEFTESKSLLMDQGIVEASSQMTMGHNNAVYLRKTATYPNKDYVLRFRRDNAEKDFSCASYYSSTRSEGYFALQLFPALEAEDGGARPPLEIIMMIDVSGSQRGWPLAKEKEIATSILSRLNDNDRIGILSFASSNAWAFSEKIVDATASNLTQARNYVGNLSSGGGTQLLQAVREVLSVPSTTEHDRYFIFLTDGFIGNEEEILETIRNHESNPTIFTFGAGNSLNRYFLDRAAEVGNGYATEITENENIEGPVNTAWGKIESPQLAQLTFDFGDREVLDLVKPLSNRLYAGSPVELYGRYTQGGETTVSVKGYRNGEPVVLTKTIHLANEANTNIMIPQVWAKQRIDELSIAEGTTTVNKDSIIALSTTYQVLSKYTAFLAINPRSVEEEGGYSDGFLHAVPTVIDQTKTELSLRIIVDKGVLTVTIPRGDALRGLTVYDVSGRMVFQMKFRQPLIATRFTWDGMLGSGQQLRPGRYIVQLKFANRTVVRPLAWH